MVCSLLSSDCSCRPSMRVRGAAAFGAFGEGAEPGPGRRRLGACLLASPVPPERPELLQGCRCKLGRAHWAARHAPHAGLWAAPAPAPASLKPVARAGGKTGTMVSCPPLRRPWMAGGRSLEARRHHQQHVQRARASQQRPRVQQRSPAAAMPPCSRAPGASPAACCCSAALQNTAAGWHCPMAARPTPPAFGRRPCPPTPPPLPPPSAPPAAQED